MLISSFPRHQTSHARVVEKRCNVGPRMRRREGRYLDVADDGAVDVLKELNANLSHGTPGAGAPENELHPGELGTAVGLILIEDNMDVR